MTPVFTLHGRLDEAEIDRLAANGTIAQLHAARAELVTKQQQIEAQLTADRADEREAIANSIDKGMSFQEANLQSFTETDHGWRARARFKLRIISAALSRINARLTALGMKITPYGAVVVPAAGRSATSTAAALNALLQGGSRVMAFSVVDGDLIVVASEPKERRAEDP